MTLGNTNLGAGTAARAQTHWPAVPPPVAGPARDETQEAEGPGEQTQALAFILSALGNMGEVSGDEGGSGGQSQGDDAESGPNLSGQDVLRLLEVETKHLIQDEADAWARMLPPNDVLFTAPTHHEVYRARAAHLIQSEVTPRPPMVTTNRQRSLPQDSLLRNQLIRAQFSAEEARAKTHRRIV